MGKGVYHQKVIDTETKFPFMIYKLETLSS